VALGGYSKFYAVFAGFVLQQVDLGHLGTLLMSTMVVDMVCLIEKCALH
jgi:hypothetical protein